MNDHGLIELNSRRAYEGRLGKRIGKNGFTALIALGTLCLLGAAALAVLVKRHYGLFLISPALLFYLPAIWWRRYLSVLPPQEGDTSLTGRLSVDVLSHLKPSQVLTAKTVWEALKTHWQTNFIINRLLLPEVLIANTLSELNQDILPEALIQAVHLADKNNTPAIEPGYVISSLILSIPNASAMLTNFQIRPDDVIEVTNWLGRELAEMERQKKGQSFGGFARDWSFGFTPLLNRFGNNISLTIADRGLHFGALIESKGVLAMEEAFKNRTRAVALVGPVGIGKSNSVYALAQRLIEGKTNQILAYHQVVELKATSIVSSARGPGDLEHIMVSLVNEAYHAGHIMLFLDDAELYMSSGPGGFDATQILQSVIQSGGVPIVIALTPHGFERLKSLNPALAGLLTPVVLQEPSESSVMRMLEDATFGLEIRHHILITYDGLQEAYRLSGRYEQDEAYPGKAIKLLEQSVSHTMSSILTRESVQQAIEQTHGVKVGSAAPAEADQLLNLETKIHERMINQSHAVSVVANSLRRARAGVTNPRRPIGSFLFLGPTGVGKTELAKALAATYFHAESNMIRLDMSEYQQPSDVSRLLSDGSSESQSLIMAVRQQPFSVVLLDEIEKAHPNILNLLLQLLDEGHLTDTGGRQVSFKDCVIIATSNAGAQSIREHVARGESLEKLHDQLVEELISSGQFKPELINRFDEIVLFRPLNAEELSQIVSLMLNEINQTLSNQHISVSLTSAAAERIVSAGYDPRLGARPMRRTLQKAVENTVAQKILRGEARAGDHIELDDKDLDL